MPMGWREIDRRIGEQADDLYEILVQTGVPPEAARIESDQLARQIWESLERMNAVIDAEKAGLDALRRYGITCRDHPLDDGETALQARQDALAAMQRAAVDLVRIDGAQIEEE
jgi:hypothetical protein